jgi:hypothetical protein
MEGFPSRRCPRRNNDVLGGKTVMRVSKALEGDNISSEAKGRKFVARLVVIRESG